MLNITDIRVRLVKKEDLKLKAVASVTIDGEVHKNLVLNSTYDFGTGSRFSFREMTTEEKLNKQITDTQIGLAEVYEMILSQ